MPVAYNIKKLLIHLVHGGKTMTTIIYTAKQAFVSVIKNYPLQVLAIFFIVIFAKGFFTILG